MFSSFVEPLDPAIGSLFVVFLFYRTAGSSHRFLVSGNPVLSNCWSRPSVPCKRYSCFIELLEPAIGSSFVVFSIYRTAGPSHRFLVCSISVLLNCWSQPPVLRL